MAWYFFDGVVVGLSCIGGARGMICLSHFLWFKFSAKFGLVTNNITYFFSIHMTMKLAIHLKIKHLQVYGDSLLVVEWLNNKILSKNIFLRPIMDDIEH